VVSFLGPRSFLSKATVPRKALQEKGGSCINEDTVMTIIIPEGCIGQRFGVTHISEEIGKGTVLLC
jgi:hypothetical protein